MKKVIHIISSKYFSTCFVILSHETFTKYTYIVHCNDRDENNEMIQKQILCILFLNHDCTDLLSSIHIEMIKEEAQEKHKLG